MSAHRILLSDWADDQADLRLRWAHTPYVGFIMSWLIYSCMHCMILYSKPGIIFRRDFERFAEFLDNFQIEIDLPVGRINIMQKNSH